MCAVIDSALVSVVNIDDEDAFAYYIYFFLFIQNVGAMPVYRTIYSFLRMNKKIGGDFSEIYKVMLYMYTFYMYTLSPNTINCNKNFRIFSINFT